MLKDFNGKPITNAHVIFHPTEGDRDKGSLELKTNEDGKAIIDVIPIGDTVTLQVIADGYQTYGQSYKIDKPEMTMEVHMKRPGGQYSIYKNTRLQFGGAVPAALRTRPPARPRLPLKTNLPAPAASRTRTRHRRRPSNSLAPASHTFELPVLAVLGTGVLAPLRSLGLN